MARDSVQLAEGERQTRINGCFTCHGEDLSGTILIDAPPFFVVAPNLTSGAGGIDATYSIEDWDRAVRNGVRPTGKPLIPIMPTRTYHRLADEPFANLVAYIRQLPPIDNEHPPSKMRLLGQVLLGVGAMDAQEGVTTANQRRPPPAPGPTAEFGGYLASITCAACHGDDFEGAPPLEPNTPAIPTIRTVGLWPFADFDRAVRQGTAPDGRRYDPIMPSADLAFMTDTEVTALHQYFGTLSPSASP